MKLGLAVVYLVKEDSEPLLRIHLERIRRHTSVPWVIHGTALRLPESFRHHLESPDLRLHTITPPTEVLAHVEHSFLLTELLDRADDDGCTHLCTLHVDSFPLMDGWAEAMAGRLTAQAPVVAVMEEQEGDTMARPNLCGMMTSAEFWRAARPHFLPSPQLEASEAWRAFMQRHGQHVTHSGVGLGYELEQAGLTWTPLRRTNSRTRHPVLAGIYGNLLFHLGAATRTKNFMSDTSPTPEPAFMRFRRRLAGRVRPWVPRWLRRRARPLLPLAHLYDQRPQRRNEEIFQTIRTELFADPDAFIAAAREDVLPLA